LYQFMRLLAGVTAAYMLPAKVAKTNTT